MSHKITIVVIDDEPMLRLTICDALTKEGYVTYHAGTGKEGMKLLQKEDPDILITDLRLPDKDGIQILKEAKTLNPKMLVILITAYGSIDSAVMAMKEGAADYVTKPFSMEEILLMIGRLIRMRQLEEENLLLKKRVEDRYDLAGLVGKSPPMLEIYELIETVAPTDTTVLITAKAARAKRWWQTPFIS